VAVLKAGIAAGLSGPAIAAQLGRTLDAVQNRAWRDGLRLSTRKMPESRADRRAWEEDELARLKAMLDRGDAVKDIAIALGRQKSSVALVMHRQGWRARVARATGPPVLDRFAVMVALGVDAGQAAAEVYGNASAANWALAQIGRARPVVGKEG
jgi:hypothetical protein